jgi:hypothetical protein
MYLGGDFDLVGLLPDPPFQGRGWSFQKVKIILAAIDAGVQRLGERWNGIA